MTVTDDGTRPALSATGLPRGLVGRDDELEVLFSRLASVSEGGSATVVTGDAGAGRTSLLDAVAARAHALGWRVVRTDGAEPGRQRPFSALHPLLTTMLRGIGAIAPVQQQALLTALGLTPGPHPQRFLVALATHSLLAATAANRPLVALVDDVQWIDQPSQEVLAFVSRRLADERVALVATVRGAAPDPFASAAEDEIRLGPLPDQAARELLSRNASDLPPATREHILLECAGNPLALVERPAVWRTASWGLTAAASGPGLPLSSRLERAFGGPVLDALPGATRDALLVAAVAAQDELGDVLGAAGRLRGRPVHVDALEPAARAGLLSFDARRLAFRHPLVRAGVLQRESTTRRQDAQSALAEVSTDPLHRIWHRAQAVVGPDDALSDELETAATDNLAAGRVADAIRSWQRSAELTTDAAVRGRRLLLAAEHAFGLGRADLVDGLVAAAQRHRLAPADQVRAGWLREVFDDGVVGDPRRVGELCDAARRSAREGQTDLALHLLVASALRCWWADPGPAARAGVVDAAAGLPATALDPRHVLVLALAEPLRQGAVVMARLQRHAPETITDPDALRQLAMAAHAVGDQVRAGELVDRAEVLLREQGRRGLLAQVLVLAGAVRGDLGDLRRSVSASVEGHRLADEGAQPVWSSSALVNHARSAALLGDAPLALRLADEVQQQRSSRPMAALLAGAATARGLAHLGAGRPVEAYEALRPLFEPGDPCHHEREQLGAVMFFAEAAAGAGQHEHARLVVERLERLAGVSPSPLLRVHLLYARPVLAEDEDAQALFEQALGAALARWPWVRARVQHAYGGWLRRQRRGTEAREPLRSALATLEVIGAAGWAEQVRHELRAAGGRTDAVAAGPVAQVLSAQELQIARLAADGLSNREIGDRLYLSHRTVGSHLYRIFPKLDITSRGQLSGRLARVEAGDVVDGAATGT